MNKIKNIKGAASQGRSIVVYEPNLFSDKELSAMLDTYHTLVIKSEPKNQDRFLNISHSKIDMDYVHIAASSNIVNQALEKRSSLRNKHNSWDFYLKENSLDESEFDSLTRLYVKAGLTPLPQDFFVRKDTATVLVRDANKNIHGACSILFLENKTAMILAGFLDRPLQGQGIAHKFVFEYLNYAVPKVEYVWTMTHRRNHHVVKLYEFFGFHQDDKVQWVVLKK